MLIKKVLIVLKRKKYKHEDDMFICHTIRRHVAVFIKQNIDKEGTSKHKINATKKKKASEWLYYYQ